MYELKLQDWYLYQKSMKNDNKSFNLFRIVFKKKAKIIHMVTSGTQVLPEFIMITKM